MNDVLIKRKIYARRQAQHIAIAFIPLILRNEYNSVYTIVMGHTVANSGKENVFICAERKQRQRKID